MSKILVRFETQEMKRALDVAGSVINRKNALPILGCVVLRYLKQQNMFQMLASNSEQSVILDCTSEVKVGDEMVRRPWLNMIEDDQKQPFQEVVISHQTLREAVATLPTMPCMAWIDTAEHTLRVDYQTGKFSLPTEESADGFVVVPEVVTKEINPSAAVLRMTTNDAQWLLQSMAQARTCAASDELRPVMNTVCMDMFQDMMRIVASDGHSLFRLQKDTGMGYLDYGQFSSDQSATVLIPKETLGILTKTFSDAKTLTVTADRQRVEFRTEGASVRSVLIEGRFPNYEAVIPKDNSHEVLVGRSELMAVLRRVQVFADGSSNMVEIKRDGEHLILSACDYDFNRQADERVTIANAERTTLPDNFCIGCKISTLLSLLQIMSSEDVRLLFSGPSRAFLLKPEDAKVNLTLLQMPMLVEQK